MAKVYSYSAVLSRGFSGQFNHIHVAWRDATETGDAPADCNAGSGGFFAQVIVEQVGVVGLLPGGFGLRKEAVGGAFALGAVAVYHRIYDDAAGSACQQALGEWLNAGIGQAGADGDLRWNAGIVSGAYKLPAFCERWAAFEPFEIRLIVGLDGDGEPGVGNLPHEREVAFGERRARLNDEQVEIGIVGEDFEALPRGLKLALKWLVGVGAAAHEDAQMLTGGRLHFAQRLCQQWRGVGFDLHRVTPAIGKAAHLPVGEKLRVAVEAAGGLPETTANIRR